MSRNLIDKYTSWTEDLIREDLKKSSFPYAVCMENIDGDFNQGTLIRNANAFGASEVFYIGQKKWDRRSAVGTHIYTKLNYLKDYSELEMLSERYTLVAIDNIMEYGPISIESYEWNKNSLMIFGSEGNGLTEKVIKMCKSMVYIPQYGSVRSLNVGSASAVVMFDYVRKYNAINSKSG